MRNMNHGRYRGRRGNNGLFWRVAMFLRVLPSAVSGAERGIVPAFLLALMLPVVAVAQGPTANPPTGVIPSLQTCDVTPPTTDPFGIKVSWTAPVPTGPFQTPSGYAVNYRTSTQNAWAAFATGIANTATSVEADLPVPPGPYLSTLNFQVVATWQGGSPTAGVSSDGTRQVAAFGPKPNAAVSGTEVVFTWDEVTIPKSSYLLEPALFMNLLMEGSLGG